MKKAIITTGRKEQETSRQLAEKIAAELNIPLVERKKRSADRLKKEYAADFILVAKDGMLRLLTPTGELFFHPNMAHLRIKNLRKGLGDHMVEAMQLKEGMTVLDCTLGMGADAIVASFVAGDNGQVTGVEVNPYLAAVIRHGCANFTADNQSVCAAMRRVKVESADYLDYLKTRPDKSFDIVYFDPMFRHPLEKSASLAPLRGAADHRPVSPEAIAEARRVAKKRIVFKENSRSHEFQRLGMDYVLGGKYSAVHYGVIELE